MYHAKDFQEAVDKAEHLVLAGGPGHTASLYVHPAQGEKIAKFQHVMKACRIVINTPSSHGGIGDLYNFGMKPSLTLGCGSWGGNSVSENVGVKHLVPNVKTVAERRENMLCAGCAEPQQHVLAALCHGLTLIGVPFRPNVTGDGVATPGSRRAQG